VLLLNQFAGESQERYLDDISPFASPLRGLLAIVARFGTRPSAAGLLHL